MPSRATLDELRAFVAVREAGGFTAAAKRLGVSTNAVSARVQKLEASLGASLFVRSTREVAPTDEGEGFYRRVAELLAGLEAAEDELRPAGRGLRGVVRIAVPGAVATASLFARLAELLDAHPALAVHTKVSNAPVNLTAEGLDVALVVGRPPDSSLVGRRLGRVTWVLAAAPSYLDRHGRPASPAALVGHRCLRLLANPPQDEWTLVGRRGAELTVRVGGGFEADDSRALGEATYAGLGIGVRPAGECARAVAEGRLERVLPGHRFQPLDVFALSPRERARVPRVAACIDALRAAVLELA